KRQKKPLVPVQEFFSYIYLTKGLKPFGVLISLLMTCDIIQPTRHNKNKQNILLIPLFCNRFHLY
ncbi:hypothetical protein ABEX44_29945, partial [Priestia megaterium]